MKLMKIELLIVTRDSGFKTTSECSQIADIAQRNSNKSFLLCHMLLVQRVVK